MRKPKSTNETKKKKGMEKSKVKKWVNVKTGIARSG